MGLPDIFSLLKTCDNNEISIKNRESPLQQKKRSPKSVDNWPANPTARSYNYQNEIHIQVY